MFTVTLDCELSGKSNTRRPLSSWYSVMPSTEATFFGDAAARHKGTAARNRQLSGKRIEVMVEHW